MSSYMLSFIVKLTRSVIFPIKLLCMYACVYVCMQYIREVTPTDGRVEVILVSRWHQS